MASLFGLSSLSFSSLGEELAIARQSYSGLVSGHQSELTAQAALAASKHAQLSAKLDQKEEALKEKESALTQLREELQGLKCALEKAQTENQALQHKNAALSSELMQLAMVGKAVWERYFGEVGAEPRLPRDIGQIMDSPCPFWEGKHVRETHLLVLIPERVSGQALTLDYLGELIEQPRGGGHGTKYRDYSNYARQAVGSKGSGSSYWVLMTRDVLEGSRNKNYKDQCALVADHAKRTGLAYEVPGALEAAVAMLLHHVRSGERLYSDNPWTYTRCRDTSTLGSHLVVGGFSSGGLDIPHDRFDSYDYGVAGLRKF